MDDLKLFVKNDQQLQGLLNIVKQFSDDIWMEFGLNKCAKSYIFPWKASEGQEHYSRYHNGHYRS